MNTEYGKSGNIKYSYGAAEACQHSTHAVWPHTERRVFSLFDSEKNFKRELHRHYAEALLIILFPI